MSPGMFHFKEIYLIFEENIRNILKNQKTFEKI